MSFILYNVLDEAINRLQDIKTFCSSSKAYICILFIFTVLFHDFYLINGIGKVHGMVV